MQAKKSDLEWKKQLTPEQFKILREKRTEPAFTGKYVDMHEDGIYSCVACGNKLFDSSAKFDSGSGWPSFYDVLSKGNVALEDDISHGMHRIEISCANCGGHLGHMFEDGPQDKTGIRYCVNSCSLNFKPKK